MHGGLPAGPRGPRGAPGCLPSTDGRKAVQRHPGTARTAARHPGCQHIHSRIDVTELPVTHHTRRSGRPYTLVLIKTHELFARDEAAGSSPGPTWRSWMMRLRPVTSVARPTTGDAPGGPDRTRPPSVEQQLGG